MKEIRKIGRLLSALAALPVVAYAGARFVLLPLVADACRDLWHGYWYEQARLYRRYRCQMPWLTALVADWPPKSGFVVIKDAGERPYNFWELPGACREDIWVRISGKTEQIPPSIGGETTRERVESFLASRGTPRVDGLAFRSKGALWAVRPNPYHRRLLLFVRSFYPGMA